MDGSIPKGTAKPYLILLSGSCSTHCHGTCLTEGRGGTCLTKWGGDTCLTEGRVRVRLAGNFWSAWSHSHTAWTFAEAVGIPDVARRTYPRVARLKELGQRLCNGCT